MWAPGPGARLKPGPPATSQLHDPGQSLSLSVPFPLQQNRLVPRTK